MAVKVASSKSDGIMDSSPEMDFNSPEFAAALAGKAVEKKEEKAKESAEETAEKDPESASDEAETEKESDEKEESSKEEDTKDESEPASVKALRKELKRVRAANREKDEKLESLEAKVNQLAEKSDTKELSEKDRQVVKLTKMSDPDFKRVSNEWRDELVDATAKLHVAQARGDAEAEESAKQRVARAKVAQDLLDEAKEKRAEVTVRSKEKEDEERGHIEESLAAIQDDFLKTLPALKDHESEAFKAGEREYNRHRALMSKMGPMGQMLAVALAIIRNPKLVGRDAVAARKELINNVEEAASKALETGVKGGTKGKGIQMPEPGTQSFEDFIERLKSGG